MTLDGRGEDGKGWTVERRGVSSSLSQVRLHDTTCTTLLSVAQLGEA